MRYRLIVGTFLATVGCAATGPARSLPSRSEQSDESKCASLAPKLKAESAVERADAADALGALGPEAVCAIDGLRALTRDELWDVRIRAMRALGQIGPRAISAAPDLMQAVFAYEHQPVESAAEHAIDALPKLGPGVIPLMLPWLEVELDDTGDTKGTFGVAATVLGKIGAPAVPALLEALKVPSRQVGAVNALGNIGREAAPSVPMLIGTYENNKDYYLRFALLEAFGKIGPAAAASVPLLVDAVATGDVSFRTIAVMALGKVGPAAQAATPMLEQVARDPRQPAVVVNAAKKALAQIQGRTSQ